MEDKRLIYLGSVESEMARNRLKRICFTLNNYTEEDERRIQESSEIYRYAIYGRELAPTSGTPHLQGNQWGTLNRGDGAAPQTPCLNRSCCL